MSSMDIKTSLGNDEIRAKDPGDTTGVYQYVAQAGGSTINSGLVNCGSSTPTVIVAANTSRFKVTLSNVNGTGTVYILGASSGASSAGYGLPAGQQLPPLYTQSGLWAIASSGTCNVTYLEESY